MKIPFGENAPNFEETCLLAKLGFSISNINQRGKYYWLEMPENPRMDYKKRTPAFDRSHSIISLNGIEIITISQKTASYDSYVYFNFDLPAIDNALAKNAEKHEPIKKVLTEYQTSLRTPLLALESIIFESGAQRGYGKYIGHELERLRNLKQLNPGEHDAFVYSESNYKKLLEMFPDWLDSNNLQPTYEAQDVGPYLCMAAAADDGEPSCRIS